MYARFPCASRIAASRSAPLQPGYWILTLICERLLRSGTAAPCHLCSASGPCRNWARTREHSPARHASNAPTIRRPPPGGTARTKRVNSTLPTTHTGFSRGRLTFDMRGGRKWAKPACGRPLDGGVRRRLAGLAAFKSKEREGRSAYSNRLTNTVPDFPSAATCSQVAVAAPAESVAMLTLPSVEV